MLELKKLSRNFGLLMMLLSANLMGCGTAPTPQPGNTSPVPTKQALACQELPPLVFQPGSPNVSQEAIIETMKQHPENPLGYARGLLGDTMSTREAIAQNRSRRVALGCRNP